MTRFCLVCALLVALLELVALSPAHATPQSSAYVREYQSLLKQTGYYRGALDGIRGPATESAILRFQKEHGLAADGVVGPTTMAALRRAAATYVVRKGDTLNEIAASYGVTVKWLCQVNGIRDPDLIRPGQKLVVRDLGTGAQQGRSTPEPADSPSQPVSDAPQPEEGPAWETFLPGTSSPESPRSGLLGARVALTFDDAPHAGTGAILEVLARHGVRATFFLIGERIAQNRDQVLRMVAAGHELGNHSYCHRILVGHDPADVEKDLSAAQAAVASVAGRKPLLFRPPGGALDRAVAAAAARQGLTTVLWHNVGATDDCPLPAEELARRIAVRCYDGYIVMLHADRPGTAALVDNLVRLLTAAGARLVTLSELGVP
ncbi:MAG: polysaccharide deacetylase family protein [Bacillota bacterium]|nr:polysaccharide deacetylase family protein [Bacillota bacterium]